MSTSASTTLSSGDIARFAHGSSSSTSDSCSQDFSSSDLGMPISVPTMRTPPTAVVVPGLPVDFHTGLVAMCQAILHSEGLTVEDMPWFGLNCWELNADKRDPVWFFYQATPKSADRQAMNVAWRGVNSLYRSSKIPEWRADRVIGCKCQCQHKELEYGNGVCVAELAWMIRKCVELRGKRLCEDVSPPSIVHFLRQFPEGQELAHRLHIEWRILCDEKTRKAVLRLAKRNARRARIDQARKASRDAREARKARA